MVALAVRMAVTGRLDQYDQALAQTHTGAVRSAVNRIRAQGRRQIERAGLGRLQNTWRGTIHDADTGSNITRRGTAINPRGHVYSNARVKGRVDDLLEVFERGVVITPEGQFLAIPTALAGGRRAVSPQDYSRGTFRRVPLRRRGRGAAFVLVHREKNEVWYTLVPTVRLKRRLRLRALVERIGARIPADVDRRWARALLRLEKAG